MVYLQKVKDIVDRCAKYNITVLLDAHQDVLSRYYLFYTLDSFVEKDFLIGPYLDLNIYFPSP